jgi:hypothetical protein
MSKYVVPEGMLKAVDKAIGEMRLGQASRLAPRNGELWPNELKQVALEAAIGWLDGKLTEFDQPGAFDQYRNGYNAAIRCVRRMFLAPEPEVPEAIKDLMWSQPLYKCDTEFYEAIPNANASVLEAYRRGKAGK